VLEEIGKILPIVFKPQWSRLEPPVVEVLAPLWSRVAGKALACHCRPVAFNAGTLTLATESAEWTEPVKQLAEEIRAAVNKFLGKPVVKRLRIRCGKLGRSDRTQRQPEDPLVSGPDRTDWPGEVSGAAPDAAQVTGQSYSGCSVRKRGKVH
jgi:hypothetical protein